MVGIYSFHFRFFFFMFMCTLEAHFVLDLLVLYDKIIYDLFIFSLPLSHSLHHFLTDTQTQTHAFSLCRSLVGLVGWLLPKKEKSSLESHLFEQCNRDAYFIDYKVL